MDVILKEDIERLGFKNEIVRVKNGYARNYLIPKKLAVLATDSAVKVLNEALRQQEKKEELNINAANKIADGISKLDIILKEKVTEDSNKLFGSIKVSQFVEAIDALGYKLNSKFVKLPKIKELGDYEADVRLHRNINISVPFKVIKG
jgi:large subunit ribosomal protein L9